MVASFFHYIVIIFFSYCDSVFGIFINFQQCQSCEIGNYSMGYYLPRHSWQYSLSSHSASPRDWKIYTTIHDSASNIPYCNFLLTGLTHYPQSMFAVELVSVDFAVEIKQCLVVVNASVKSNGMSFLFHFFFKSLLLQ